MLTTGSKLFLGLSSLAFVALVVYGVTQNFGALGSIGLLSLLVVAAGLGAFTLYTRDANVSSMDDVQVRTAAAAAEPVSASAWPLVGALGGVLLVIGVITDARWFVAGIVVIIVAVTEWMILAWSERASADQAYNAEVRERVLHPAELPIAGAVVLVVIIFGFSRMMLALPRDAGPPLFVVAAGLIAAFGAILARRSSVRKGVVAGICAVGIVAVLAGGIASAVTGERDELTEAEEEDHFSERHCSAELDEHTDEKTSGAVAAKASTLATFTLRDDGTLELEQIAGSLPGTVLTIDRGNTVNVLFENQTEEERRLRIYGGTVERDVNGTMVSEVTEFCTQAIAEGDTQILTFSLPRPSVYGDDPFYAEVPGVEGARIEIVVP
jgi:FlaG/FlaF family flagellin (archaellin)